MDTSVYANAPITEATFDIRVRLPASVTMASLERVTDPLYPDIFRHPTRVEIRVAESEATPSAFAEVSNTQLGFSYKDVTGRQAFQIRSDGFTFNQLAPYSSWAVFSEEAKRLWPAYKRGANPEVIELVGLNYINQINVPIGKAFEDYFSLYVHVPTELPQELNSFMFGIQVTDKENDCLLHISQSYGAQIGPDSVAIMLNIQAFRPLNLPTVEVQDEQLWSIFEKLRRAKDRAFESSITDRVREAIR